MVSNIAVEDPATPNSLVMVLRSAGLISDSTVLTPLTGGVASDIWRAEADGKVFVVKRALSKLKVAADWRAPISRNSSEAAWFSVVHGIAPLCVPRILFHDVGLGLFAMTFFDPETYPVWKSQLMRGVSDVAFSAAVGRTMARIHGATFNNPEIARQFDNDDTFHAIRLEPYLEETARRHSAVGSQLMALSRRTGAYHLALVHGDMSPKNILVGPQGPIFLDAECAWYGDPAFDLAFCLNHLLLKCVHAPLALLDFMASFDAMHSAYLAELTGVDGVAIVQRAAELLPALLLARVDGKSPVEYLTTEAQRNRVRGFALQMLVAPYFGLAAMGDRWTRALSSGFTGPA